MAPIEPLANTQNEREGARVYLGRAPNRGKRVLDNEVDVSASEDEQGDGVQGSLVAALRRVLNYAEGMIASIERSEFLSTGVVEDKHFETGCAFHGMAEEVEPSIVDNSAQLAS